MKSCVVTELAEKKRDAYYWVIDFMRPMGETMQTVFTAIWYDPKKVEANAIKAGWDPTGGGGFLDIYSPEEDPKACEAKQFTSLDVAVIFLQQIIADGKDFWGQARINKFEVGGRRCKYCTCRGWSCIHTYIVEAEGVIEDYSQDDCYNNDE